MINIPTAPLAQLAPEWVKVEDVNGKLLFEYSPLREQLRIVSRNLTSVIDLRDVREKWWREMVQKLNLETTA